MKKIFFHILFISLIASCQNNNKVSLSLQNGYLNKNGTLSTTKVYLATYLKNLKYTF